MSEQYYLISEQRAILTPEICNQTRGSKSKTKMSNMIRKRSIVEVIKPGGKKQARRWLSSPAPMGIPRLLHLLFSILGEVQTGHTRNKYNHAVLFWVLIILPTTVRIVWLLIQIMWLNSDENQSESQRIRNLHELWLLFKSHLNCADCKDYSNSGRRSRGASYNRTGSGSAGAWRPK